MCVQLGEISKQCLCLMYAYVCVCVSCYPGKFRIGQLVIALLQYILYKVSEFRDKNG